VNEATAKYRQVVPLLSTTARKNIHPYHHGSKSFLGFHRAYSEVFNSSVFKPGSLNCRKALL